MTTKHHEGFCLWDTKQTDYNAAKRGPGRDLVREYVEACREFGLKVGFYYSLMDWHHPDGKKCATDESARRRFVDFTHGCVRELMSNYGKIDILWCDVSWPLKTPKAWESLKMNKMVRKLQPRIIINDRSHLPEDFSTPEESVTPAETGRGWEACMTSNGESWGYMPAAAIDVHSPSHIVKMLFTASRNKGNLLLNIGPAPDGSIPPEAVAPLTTVGKWLAKNAEAVYGQLDRASLGGSASGNFSQKGKTAYLWCVKWLGTELPFGGFTTKLEKASFLVGGKPIKFEQSGHRLILKDLPKESPDKLVGVTVLKFEFKSKPKFIPMPTTMVL